MLLTFILQARLGPGRMHHCMRLIGAAERGMQLMVQRALSRKAFGKFIAQHGSFVSDIAKVLLELSKSKFGYKNYMEVSKQKKKNFQFYYFLLDICLLRSDLLFSAE